MRSSPRVWLFALLLAACRESEAPACASTDETGASSGAASTGVGSTSATESGDVAEPLPDPLAPPELVDLDPDPGVVEVSLVAEASQTTYLDGKVATSFEQGEKGAKAAFTADHKARMKRYKDKRYKGIPSTKGVI